MNDFATGFVTGFSNTLAEGIKERDKTARDYFEKQYEIATTVGIQNHRKVEEQVQVSIKTAKQLEQMGVPREVIMAVASQNPLGVQDFYADVIDAQQSGVPIDQEFFNEFVTISKDFKAPDEDFATFFRKSLSPIKSAASSDQEGFKSDKRGGIFGALMGVDPYGRAKEKLDNTVVIDGMSASDLAMYGDNYAPAGVQGAPTVSFDYSATKKPRTSELTISEIKSLEDALAETKKKFLTTVKEDGSSYTEQEATAMALEEVKEKFKVSPDAVKYFESLTPSEQTSGVTQEALPPTSEDLSIAGIGKEQGSGTVATEASNSPVETPTTPEATPTPETPATGFNGAMGDPIDPNAGDPVMLNIKGLQLSWYSNNDDGSATYVDQAGKEYIFSPNQVRDFVKQNGIDYKG